MVKNQKNIFLPACLSLVFLAISFFSFARASEAANFYITTNTPTVQVGDVITATVYINSGGVAINSAEGIISAPSDLFAIQSVNNAGSIFSLWVEQPTFSDGRISFSGGVPNPGYSGSTGKVLSISLLAKKSGVAPLTYQSTAIRANDGLGTNVGTNQTGQAGATISITPNTPVLVPVPEPVLVPAPTPANTLPSAPVVSSVETPHAETWYSKRSSTFRWSLPSGTTAVEILLDDQTTSEPTIVYSPAISSKTLDDLENGISYLHIRFKNSLGWGPITHRKIKIDTNAPEIVSASASLNDQGAVMLSLSANDATSRIAKFIITGDGILPIDVTKIDPDGNAQYTFVSAPEGYRILAIVAADEAGNTKQITLPVTFPKNSAPKITRHPESITRGERFTISGSAIAPKSSVVIWVKEQDQKEKRYIVDTGSDGAFVFTSEEVQHIGQVAVWAETFDPNQTQHDAASAKIYISVNESLLFRIGGTVIRGLSIALPILALLFCLGFIFYIGFHKFRKLRATIRKDLKKTHGTIHEAMSMLQNDMNEHIEALEKAKSRRRLTREEARILRTFAENIKSTEKYLQLEISKIEKEDL